jgi:hypothetical protein
MRMKSLTDTSVSKKIECKESGISCALVRYLLLVHGSESMEQLQNNALPTLYQL